MFYFWTLLFYHFFVFQTSKDFARKMVKEWNWCKIYQLMKDLQNITILACALMKKWSINNIKVNCSQFGEKMSNIFEHVHKDVYVNSFLLLKARRWILLPAEDFSLTSYVNGCKSRVYRQQLSWGFSNQLYYMFFIFVFLFYF